MILCALNGFCGASNLILRLFLEFGLLQSYFTCNINKQESYKILNKYFQDGISPTWNKMIKHCLPNDPFCKPY